MIFKEGDILSLIVAGCMIPLVGLWLLIEITIIAPVMAIRDALK